MPLPDRFNTRNPVLPSGSADPRDRYDNTRNLDLAMNDRSNETWIDRLGVSRQTWWGMEQDFLRLLERSGFESEILQYVDGQALTVDRPTQLVQYNGNIYRVQLPAEFPFLLTGEWSEDQPKLVVVADESFIERLASESGSSMIGHHDTTVSEELDQLSIDIGALGVVNKAQPLISRSSRALSIGQGVVILGDSISAGAYSGNAYTNHWAYLLAKAINFEFGSENIGVIPTDSLYSATAASITDQLHQVTWSGDWGARTSAPEPYNNPLGNVAAAAAAAINGKTVVSTDPDAFMQIRGPAINGIASIYYVSRPGGGSFDVYVNDVLRAELNTASNTTSYNNIYNLNTPDNGKGEFVCRLVKRDSNPTEIQSIVRHTKRAGSPDNHFAVMSVSNYSISGRQLARIAESAISMASNCACLIMALGHNDRYAETDDVYYADFVQRVNWVIQHSKRNQCLVVVPDFCWYSGPESRVRTQLKRIADETNGIYIPFPDRFYPDGRIPVDTTPAASELVTSLRLFADNSHPNFKGNEMIFSEIAKALRLSLTTKAAALQNDMPFPLKINSPANNAQGTVSSVSRANNGLVYAVSITAEGGGQLPVGSIEAATIPVKFGAFALMQSIGVAALNEGGVAAHTITASDGTVSVDVTTPADISTSFFVGERL